MERYFFRKNKSIIMNIHDHRISLSKTLGIMVYLPLFIFSLLIIDCCTKDSPQANFTASSYNTVVGDSVIFTNHSTNASSYVWLFGDGRDTTSINAKHAYSKAGTYIVTLMSVGTNLSSSISKTITVQGTISIYEGVGITQVSLSDIWYNIKTLLPVQDSSMSVDTSDGYYLHYVTYRKLGIGMIFFNFLPSTIDSSESPDLIAVFNPYSGYTTKGITLLDNIKLVESTYGTPGIYSAGNNTQDSLFYYDNIGIQFWVTNSSPNVVEIDVYPAENSKSAVLRNDKSKFLPVKNKIWEKK